jgi:twitching motility protein PilU
MEIMRAIVPQIGIDEFETALEFNTALDWQGGLARLRINLFRQRYLPAIVIRRISTKIPTLEELKLPKIYGQLVMEKRGLVLVVGPTGSGKTSSLAAMIGHRNRNGAGHIVTIEDPEEFMHEHVGCVVSQRDVGVDTLSFDAALKNTLRQSPDIIMIGEVRDTRVMEHAIAFAETGHLVLATLHANNSNQAIERVLNFFPEERHKQILLNLTMNLRAVVSQRLITTGVGKRVLAVEIMLNQGLVRNLIEEGKVREIKEIIEKSRDQGMQSFDQALFDLYKNGDISEEQAMAEADSPANLRVLFKQVDVQRKMTALGSDGHL